MKRNKKGALDVSINAIVVIIFAITMLGLGLAFMKGTFGKIGGEVDKTIGTSGVQVNPTADNPVQVLPSNIELQKGKKRDLEVGVYNSDTDSAQVSATLSCTGVTFTPTPLIPRENVPLGSSAEWKVVVESANAGTKVCTITATAGAINYPAENFIIEVK